LKGFAKARRDRGLLRLKLEVRRTNDNTTERLAETLPPRDFLIRDYELKIKYLTDHFSRMWTRFNYFVGIESALVGGKLIFGGECCRAKWRSRARGDVVDL
jgi:hypothetical protein